MQQWEYRTAVVGGHDVFEVDGQDLPYRKNAKGRSVPQLWMDYAKELGEQGWELAGVICGDNQSNFTAFFKRPKA
jgi:hypothetical protein